MKIAIAATIGGHLAELMMIKEALGEHDCFIITSETDRSFDYCHYQVDLTPFSYFKGIISFYRVLKIFLKEMPDVVISTGAEIAVPCFFWSKIFFKKTVFMETVTRFSDVTMSARVCYCMSSVFLVQHETSLKFFGKKAQYWGSVI